MQTKSLVSYSSEDLSSILNKIETLKKELKLNLDISLNRDHIIDEKGSRQEATIHFTGKIESDCKENFEKFKQQVQTLISDSEHSVKYDVKFVDKKQVFSLKEEEQANKKLAESHNKMRESLTGIEKPVIRMTSRRTYSSKDGEKFSGNLYIGGDCPSDLKENFIKYYDEVAKPVPEDYVRKNEAKLKPEPSKPLVSCEICKANLEDKEVVYSCKPCEKDKKSETIICENCVNNENALANFSHSHHVVLIPKKNEARRKAHLAQRDLPSNLSLWRDLNDLDSFSRSLLSATEPLNRRFREFERIADRIDREFGSGFNRPSSIFDEILFPFERRTGLF
jgi:hypothetical protein